jgi:hypothetical protein
MADLDGFLGNSVSWAGGSSRSPRVFDGKVGNMYCAPVIIPPEYVAPTSVVPLVKTWQFDVNQVFGSTDGPTVRKELLFRIKESLIGFEVSPWVVAGSSDSINGAMDGIDRWLSPANIINGNYGNPNSWIVLEQPGLGGLQMLMNVGWGADIAVGRVDISQTGSFAGGTSTQRPGAVDVKSILPTQQYFANYSISPSVGADIALHVMQSTDGKCTRIVGFNTRDASLNQECGVFAIIDEISDPTPGWSPAILAGWDGSYNNNYQVIYAGRYNSSVNMFGEHDGTQMEFRMTTMGVGSNHMGITLSGRNADGTNDWPIMGIGLVSFTGGKEGRHGRLEDLFFGMINAPDRMIYDAEFDATQTLAQVGDMVFPWPVGIPVMM